MRGAPAERQDRVARAAVPGLPAQDRAGEYVPLRRGALLGSVLPVSLVGRQEQDPGDDERRLSQAQRWQGELSSIQRLPPVDINLSGCCNYCRL